MAARNRRWYARLRVRELTTRAALVLCGVGVLLIIVGAIATEYGPSPVVGTGIVVIGALASLYGMVFVMLYGFATLGATVAVVVRIFRRKPPTDGESGDEE